MAPNRVLTAGLGLIALLAPRRLLGLHQRLSLIGFHDSDAPEPSKWLITATRLSGVALLWAALVAREDSDNSDQDQAEFI